jgi:hypothetical protein
MSRRLCLWSLCVLLGCAAAGCGSQPSPPPPLPEAGGSSSSTTGTTPPPPPPPGETAIRDDGDRERAGATPEELDAVPPPPPVGASAEGWVDAAPPPAPEPTARSTFGYRVQVFASATQEGAERAAAEARGLFSGRVHIDFEPPFFKVRVGDCTTRHEAERLRERAVQLGYEGPFVTETQVDVR